MLPESLIALAAGGAVYHHVCYPFLLKHLAAAARGTAMEPPARDEALRPTVEIIIPAHNEAKFIEQKIANCLSLDYPAELLSIVLACDGCTDDTAALAKRASEESPDRVTVLDFEHQRGKVATLNEVIARSEADIVMLTDASAMMDAGAVQSAVAHFRDAQVGVVCPTYVLGSTRSVGEAAYWRYQAAIKADEAAVGAPIGAHGACYFFRRAAWRPLPADTINDDVILPMRIVASGFRAIYDPSIQALEAEPTQEGQDWRRRLRIGAGNMQQLIRLFALANPRRPGIAFTFLSGKALRTLLPFLAVGALVSIMISAAQGDHTMRLLLVMLVLAALSGVLVAGTAAVVAPEGKVARAAAMLTYAVRGYAASFVGACGYLLGRHRRPWTRVDVERSDEGQYAPRSVIVGKRIVDIICGLGALAVMVVLFIPIAIAIKLDSRGPIFYRQKRVGRLTPTACHVYHLIKFRTMRQDAEAATGAVWASKDDPRITRTGRFMRKTRLDELPQCINVLKGEMSVIGPRPERPGFFNRLEDAIPFYAERTYGLKPGITGLAQVNLGYDADIEDVRMKVLYDHTYAARLTSWRQWWRTDLSIVVSTVSVMALGKGQ